jgi:hypothetical protein
MSTRKYFVVGKKLLKQSVSKKYRPIPGLVEPLDWHLPSSKNDRPKPKLKACNKKLKVRVVYASSDRELLLNLSEGDRAWRLAEGKLVEVSA